MRFILILWCLSVATGLISQDWQATLKNDGKNALCRNIEVRNDTIYAFWNRLRDTSGFAGITLLKLDSSGNQLDTLNLFIDGRYLTSSGYFVSGMELQSTDEVKVYGMDLNANIYLASFNFKTRQKSIIFYPSFGPGTQWQGNTAMLATSSGLYLTGVVQRTDSYGTLDAFVIHTDLEGNEIWRKTYGQVGFDEYVFSIAKINENEIILAGGRASPFNAGIPLNQTISKEWMLCIDTMGNQKWEKESANNMRRSAMRSMSYKNGKYYYAGAQGVFLPQFNDFVIHPFLACRDSLFNLVWETPLVNIVPSQLLNLWSAILIDNDSSFVGSGRIWFGGPIVHLKVRQKDGSVIFQRNDTICTPDIQPWGTPPKLSPYEVALYDIASLSSGSTVSCGMVDVNTTDGRRIYGYLIKTNAYGQDLLDDCSTVSSNEPQYQIEQVFIYPNPCLDHISVQAPAYTGAYRVRLYASTGALVQEQRFGAGEQGSMELNALASGLYFVQLVSDQGVVLAVGKVVKM